VLLRVERAAPDLSLLWVRAPLSVPAVADPPAWFGPPRERPWVSWLAFGLGVVALFSTIPFARAVGRFVTDRWGRAALAWMVAACVVAVALLLLRLVRRRAVLTPGRAAWIVAIVVVYLAWTASIARGAPEEAVHFLEYGALSLLAFRALAHTVRDTTIYPAATLLCAIVGTVEEVLQWLTPGRVWDLADIGLNTGSGALVQLLLWQGIGPPWISAQVPARSWRRLCRLGLVATFLLGLSLANTPPRIAWYASRLPCLNYLLHRDAMMVEYGYRYESPETGVFFSRFPAEALRRHDTEHGEAAARILDAYRDEWYPDFLARYSPAVDPFVHEARVHLFRRDLFHRRIADFPDDEAERRFHATVVLREDGILARYFPHTLARSSYVLPAAERAELESMQDPGMPYVSRVSDHLLVRMTETQVLASLLAVAGLLALASWRLGRS
jgi:hypothetical protein